MEPNHGSQMKLSIGKASNLHRDKEKGVARRGKRTSTRAQLHAQATDEFFKYHILLITRKSIERVKKDVCEQVKAMPIEEVR